ncbi:MAG: helix-hairpin-helix domain-containing protein [Acidobacteriaceae bacterium]
MYLQKRLRNILCGAALAFALGALPTTSAVAQTAARNSPSMSPATKMGTMDINTASVGQLRTLPGIGDTYAQRIVKGRPYTSKNQLVTKGILPRNVYDKVQNMIIASHVKK